MKITGLAIAASVLLVGCAEWGVMTDKSLVPDAARERVEEVKAYAPPTAAQKARFGVLADMPGSTFVGIPMGDSSERLKDYQKWAWVEDGNAILISHALEDGSYGGDTIVRTTDDPNELVYEYVTNAGFTTTGSFRLDHEAGTWTSLELVEGDSPVSEVESKGVMNADGTMRMTSRYLTADGWQEGHGFIYRRTYDPLPELKPAAETAE